MGRGAPAEQARVNCLLNEVAHSQGLQEALHVKHHDTICPSAFPSKGSLVSWDHI